MAKSHLTTVIYIYGRPYFSDDDRTLYFALTRPEHDLLTSFGHLHVQIYFIHQLGYFKAKQLFFTFAFDEVADDCCLTGNLALRRFW